MVALLSRAGTTLVALMLVAAGCSADDDGDAASTTVVVSTTIAAADTAAPTTTSGLFTCDGLADRWIRLQQDYLDRLGDADEEELANGSDRVNAASAFLGPALIEHVRDAEAVGCSETLNAGSEALCIRMDRFTSGGGAADAVIERLTSTCGDPAFDDLDG